MRVHIKKAQAYAVAKIVVAKIRRTLFGQLRAPRQERGKSLDAIVKARIDFLEQRIERLEARLAKPVYANSDGLTAWTGKL